MNNEKELQTICVNIRYLRKKNKLSQKEMAKCLHVGIRSIRLLEKGMFPQRLGIHFIVHVYHVFGILPNVLVSTVLEENDCKL